MDELLEESESQRKLRAAIRIVLSLLIIVLLLSILIPSDVYNSLIEGKTVRNYTINANGKTIMFDPMTYEQLRLYYIQHQLGEFKLCLLGTINNNVYTITSFYAPKIFFATPTSVHAIICDERTTVDLHSHPFRNCLASEQDSFSQIYYKQFNPKALSMIMCDIDTFSVYGS